LSRHSIPYGRQSIEIDVPDDRLNGILRSRLHDLRPAQDGPALVRQALARPIGGPRLRELAQGKKNIVILASDHTRPVPSKVIMPPLLDELRQGNPGAAITILIATGCHRATTGAELARKFGEDIIAKEKIVLHDCDDLSMLVPLGDLPSGGRLLINRLAAEADLVVSEGFIEPHFFAGFSGGRKSVLPGIAGRATVLHNHNAAFIDHPNSRAGVLSDNLVHADMLYAAGKAGLAFIVNVVLNELGEVVYSAAGDPDLAHRAGCDFLLRQCQVRRLPADIVVVSNGGYPLDQNIYQAVKGMNTAAECVRPGGAIIMFAQSGDGHGGEAFYRLFEKGGSPDAILSRVRSAAGEDTIPDQWQAQILCRVLTRAKVVYISDLADDLTRAFHMLPAHSFPEALRIAAGLSGDANGSITIIPDGVSVIVTETEA
jgi:nickel-dependent lactate racemase